MRLLNGDAKCKHGPVNLTNLPTHRRERAPISHPGMYDFQRATTVELWMAANRVNATSVTTSSAGQHVCGPGPWIRTLAPHKAEIGICTFSG